MTPLILIPILVLVVLAMTVEIPEEYLEENEEIPVVRHLHIWSKDITNDQLVCLGCNKKAGSDA